MDAEVSSPLFFLAVVEVELVLVPIFFAPVDFFVVVSWVVAAVVELDVVSLFLAQETTNAIATKAVMERAIFFIGFCVRFSRLSAATRKTSNLLRPLPLFGSLSTRSPPLVPAMPVRLGPGCFAVYPRLPRRIFVMSRHLSP